jgi:hypothetical protein
MESAGNIWLKGPDVPGIGAGSANNGVSFDTTTNKIVLGNDVGGNAADLLSDREIVTGGFNIDLRAQSASPSARILLAGGSGSIQLERSTIGLRISDSTAVGFVDLNYIVSGTAEGGYIIQNSITIGLWIWTGTGNIRIGALPSLSTQDNGQRLQVAGNISMTHATATLNFGNTAAQSSADLTINFAGAALSDTVVLGVPNGSVLPDSCYTAWVSAAGVITVRFNNYSAGAQDPASGSFRVSIFKVT